MKIKRGEKFRNRMELQDFLAKKKGADSPPPPTTTTMTTRMTRRKSGVIKSVTRDEIDKYWRVKKMEEEEHLLAALKAAARIRARVLTGEDYKRFEESLRDVIKRANGEKDTGDENNKELRVGIKDWWTKSKYAYLNQPATRSMADDAAKTTAKFTTSASTYGKHMICSYPLAPSHSVTASLGFSKHAYRAL